MSRKSPFKLLAIDVDGTLLFDREKISVANREALLAAKDHGMVSLCTGRSPSEAQWIVEELDLKENFHILGGGSILVKPGGEIQQLSVIENDLIKEIEASIKFELAYLAQGQWRFGAEKPLGPYSSIAALASNLSMAEDLIDQLQTLAVGHFVTSVAHRDNYWIQVTGPECHKGSGIKTLVNKLGISLDEVLVIGDMYNDIPMFEAVPFSVAMGNAPAGVREKASFITKEVHNDGLAHAIWEYFFESKDLR